MNLTRRSFALASISALGFGVSGNAWADQPAVVRAVRVRQSGPQARVTLIVEGEASVRTLFLSEPNRFVIDLANSRLSLPSAASEVGTGVVRGYRYAARPGGISRIVLDLAAEARLVRQNSAAVGEVSFELISNDPQFAGPAPLSRDVTRRTIVIDAGHGGRDPGAVGVTGVREKDVVLDAALQLRTALEAMGRYQVALTRDSDRFVPLEERVAFARDQDADLFISVHADSRA